MDTNTFSPGTRIGPYELLFTLASGGMASVIVARQRGAGGFERLVVVKRVHRRHLGNVEFTNMFRDEARLASSIRHANVVPVIDVAEHEGELCLVMEYFESLSLARLAGAASNRSMRLSVGSVSRIVSDTLLGLHAAHEAVDMRRRRLGIVHRDVSPQNIIVDVTGVTRVVDFGIAKAETRITRTRTGFVKGKLGYMSPEQIESQPIDRRSDLFSAGIVLYELLTGERLFAGGDEFATMRRVLRGEITPVSMRVAGISPQLDQVVARALARDPADRFETGIEFQEALERSISPAPAHEVAAVVAELGAETLGDRHTRLIDMLRQDPDTSGARDGAPTAVPTWSTVPTMTSPAASISHGDSQLAKESSVPHRETVRAAGEPNATTVHDHSLAAPGQPSAAGETAKSSTRSARSSLRGPAMAVVAVAALTVSLAVVLHLERRPKSESPQAATTSSAVAMVPGFTAASSTATASAPPSASPPSTSSPAPVSSSAVVRGRPKDAPRPPASSVRSKPSVKPLQPNPYDDPN